MAFCDRRRMIPIQDLEFNRLIGMIPSAVWIDFAINDIFASIWGGILGVRLM